MPDAPFMDSSGTPIAVGDYVLHRGRLFTISTFMPGCGRDGIAAVVLDPGLGSTSRIHGDEWSVDKVEVVFTQTYRQAHVWCLADGRYVARIDLPWCDITTIGPGSLPEARAWLDAKIAALPGDLQPPSEP